MFEDIFQKLLHRPEKSSKTAFGHVLIVGGSPKMTGAPLLAGMAALRTGAGLATLGIPKGIHTVVAKRVLELMTLPLAETKEGTLALDAVKEVLAYIKDRKISVLALGPGLSRNEETEKAVRALVAACPVPVILDADGLNAFSGHPDELKKAARQNPGIIITPHEGEFSRLTGDTVSAIGESRTEHAKRFSQECGVTVVLKGAKTVVAHPDGAIFENTTGNPGMATAGSGDVLTGIIAGLIAQGVSSGNAAQAGVFLHGLAGDLAVREKTQPGMMSSDIVEYIPGAFLRVSGGM